MFRLIFETMFELFDYKPPNVIEYLAYIIFAMDNFIKCHFVTQNGAVDVRKPPLLLCEGAFQLL